MKKVILLFALMMVTGIFSQEKGSISGKIVDLEMNNEALLLAELCLKGTGVKTLTNFNGNFQFLNITPGDYTLVIGFMGYDSIEVPVQVSENANTVIREGIGAKSLNWSEISELVLVEKAFGVPVSTVEDDRP